MTWYVAHLDTGYCGTDNYVVFEADDEFQADSMLEELVYENATQYFEIVSAEDYDAMVEDENFDDSNYISEDGIYGSIEEYNHEVHDEHLEQYQIDEVNKNYEN